MVGHDALEVSFIADFGGIDQAEPAGTALHEEREDLRCSNWCAIMCGDLVHPNP
jgi:hypothetical protein